MIIWNSSYIYYMNIISLLKWIRLLYFMVDDVPKEKCAESYKSTQI
jgi:hypothetical protein